ncbi:cation diffusion facilitator family transporter [Candidatus Saccharibacteria bacterium]|nr:cation diffusion facilitator family transporter [Candidatus Saccharibacteria bacterium]
MARKNTRERAIIKTSVISILTNILLVGFKAAVGLAANSIAIVSDAINNLSDALSSAITIIGTKLAGKPADRKHPYGYGRIEHVTSFVVSTIVLYAGITALIESLKKIIEPEAASYDAVTIIILVAAIVVKLGLGIFVKARGREIKSAALVASGVDAFNDAILSTSVLASAVIYMIWGISLEAYVGLVVSAVIIKSGVELIREAIDEMVGTRVESKLARQIKKEIAKEPEVGGAFDLILHDFGPNKYLGSVHIEVPDTMTVAEVDKISRRITAKILKKYGVILHTVGIYSINTEDAEAAKIEREVREMVFSHDDILQMHGFYLDKTEKTISFDIIIDFSAEDQEKTYREICDEVKRRFSDYRVSVTLDVDLSD